MMLPRIRAKLERRILINYRVDAYVAAGQLPEPFRPLLVGGHAIAGICLIRLSGFALAAGPPLARFAAENAAHRFAVEWDTGDGPSAAVWIPRRDTNSALVALAGGRAFPGWHHRASFEVAEDGRRSSVAMTSDDGEVTIRVSGREAGSDLGAGSVFADVDAASQFYRRASVGYSPRPRGSGLERVELTCHGWNLRRLAIRDVSSSYFGDARRFPPGSIAFDSAFLMRDLDTTWSARPAQPAAGLAGLNR
jgi:hypothetical protein